MRKNFGAKPLLYPMPVLIIATSVSYTHLDVYKRQTLPVIFCTTAVLAAFPAAFSHSSFKTPARNMLVVLFALLLLPVVILSLIHICAAAASRLFFFEEGIERGGIGEHVGALLWQRRFRGTYCLKGIGGFVPHASMDETLHSLGLDAEGMVKTIESECKK